MSATFWNQRRRKRAVEAQAARDAALEASADSVKAELEKPAEVPEKRRKKAVKKDD